MRPAHFPRILWHLSLVALSSAVLTPQAFAARTICGTEGAERIVEVAELETGKAAPCEVRYTRHNGEPKVIYRARSQGEYCVKKAAEFVEHLKSMGLECKAE